MTRLFFLCCILLFNSFPAHANQTDGIELLNATLVARLHLSHREEDGQMVGAYQVSFRAVSDTPVTKVSVLLNPGLDVLKVVGAGNKSLQVNRRTTSITGANGLSLNATTVTLPKALKKNKGRAEIVIHYKGHLKDLSAQGLDGVPETLDPDFTMIRAQGFAYPVFASPNMVSIDQAWGRNPFHQVAFLDVPGNNAVVGNLSIAQRTTSGDITKFEMKSSRPTGPMALAIAPYRVTTSGPITTATLPQDAAAGSNFSEHVEQATAALEDMFGAPASNARMTIAALPPGYRVPEGRGAYFVNGRDLADTLALRAALFDMWRMSPDGRAGHWATGFDTVLEVIIRGEQALTTLRPSLFARSKTLMADDSALGKTALADYVIEGYSNESDAVSALAFTALRDLMGEEDFSMLVMKIRRNLGAGYTDMASVAEFLEQSVEHKHAKKLVKNWFAGGKAGKDISRADSYDELLSRYR